MGIHLNIFQKKGYWFKIWMEFLRPILVKIELICLQPAMTRPIGVIGVLSPAVGRWIRLGADEVFWVWLVCDALEESQIMVEWLDSNSLQANPCKFQGILFKGAKKADYFRFYVEGTEIEFQSEIDVLASRCLYWWWYEFQQSCK